MSSINVVILTGNLTRDPELKYTANQVAYASFGLACNKKRKDQAGDLKEETCFVECVAWKKTAEIVAQYAKKGKQVGVTGSLKLDQWTAADGSNRSKLTVVVNQLELLGGPPQDSPGHHGHYEAPAPPPQNPQQLYTNLDEIPF